jgi:peptide/nickel transport system permease protein
MLAFLIRRTIWGAVVLFTTAVLAYGIIRALRPDIYPGPFLSGLTSDLSHALRLDFGAAQCSGCGTIEELWADGYAADLWLLTGALAIGIVLGVIGGVWCATRPHTWRARALESVAMVLYCTPVYVAGLGLLLLFEPTFGFFGLPFFFEPHTYEPLLDNPWNWLRALIVPWLVLGAPIAAVCLRVTLVLSRDAMGEHFVRTAFAKGLSRARVVRRHAAPSAYSSIASLVGSTIPAVVTNAVLVEWVFSVPGFFRNTRRAIGQAGTGNPDLPTLQALALWAAVLIVVASLLADLALVMLDPRLRENGRPPG